MPTRSKYASIESAHCLKVQNIVNAIKTSVVKKNPDVSSDKVQQIVNAQIPKFSINSQSFEFSSTDNHLGGKRWYIHCPKCGKKSLKLYKPEDKEQYLCKSCHNLKSPSSLHGPTKMYQEVIRPLRRMKKIKEMLDRPISSKKAAALVKEYDKLEKELNNSDQYEIWKFREKNNIRNIPT
jgi:phage terminase large subunit GpA-like protein